MSPSRPSSFTKEGTLFCSLSSFRTDCTLSITWSDTLKTMWSLDVKTAEQFFAFWHKWPDQSLSLPVSKSFELEDSDSSKDDIFSDPLSFNEWTVLAVSELQQSIILLINIILSKFTREHSGQRMTSLSHLDSFLHCPSKSQY